MYTVLVKPDAQNRVTAVNSIDFLANTTGWIPIDQGNGDRYHHAQGNYFDAPIMDERGVWRYAYVPDAADGAPKWRERTQAEMDADYVPPAVQPDRVDALAGRVDTMETTTDDLVLMMAELIGGA